MHDEASTSRNFAETWLCYPNLRQLLALQLTRFHSLNLARLCRSDSYILRTFAPNPNGVLVTL